ncbi:MAG: Mth938-like domain-containing protein [Gammaproteobacteria bacterium]
MKLSLDISTGSNVVRGYDRGQVVVNAEVIRQSVVLLPERLIRDWPPQRFEDLHEEHIASLAALEPEIILLGTGPRLRFPDAALMRPTLGRRIGVEVMDTAAACRTFNILSAEGRRVAAALLMI